MNSKEKMNKAYIDSTLSKIFESMVNSIFQQKPEDPVKHPFFISFRLTSWSNSSETITEIALQVSYSLLTYN